MKFIKNIFNQIISLENLFSAWDEFKKDKQKKSDVLKFEFNLEQNIFQLYQSLKNCEYKHDFYTSFYIIDPKRRHIHKATVRDRVFHHAVFTILNPIFEPTFINNSFSCRVGKGTHKGISVLKNTIKKVNRNNTQTCFILKCDIVKFFANIDHQILLDIIDKKIKDKEAMRLIKEIIESFVSSESNSNRKGLPIGNLTSQLFANIYLNKFDQFVKHKLKIKHYLRYTDDFIIVDRSEKYLKKILKPIKLFLGRELRLKIHPDKIIIRKFLQGVDFLGYILLPYYCSVRVKTKQRIFKKLRRKIEDYKQGLINQKTLEQLLCSYLGVLSHANAHKLSQALKNQFWFWLRE